MYVHLNIKTLLVVYMQSIDAIKNIDFYIHVIKNDFD